MNLAIQIAIIICSIYIGYIGLFMFLFKGRQKRLIQNVIKDEAKAKEYGKVCGGLTLLTGVVDGVSAVIWLVSGNTLLWRIVEVVTVAFAFGNLYLNNKYAGTSTIPMY